MQQKLSEAAGYKNGSNGTSGQTLSIADEGVSGSSELLDNVEPARQAVVRLVLQGNTSDAQVMYFAMPGSSLEGWNYLERLVMPVRNYVEAGDPPYIKPLEISEYAGTPTPDGDCAEDARPAELQNQQRLAAEREWFEKN